MNFHLFPVAIAAIAVMAMTPLAARGVQSDDPQSVMVFDNAKFLLRFDLKRLKSLVTMDDIEQLESIEALIQGFTTMPASEATAVDLQFGSDQIFDKAFDQNVSATVGITFGFERPIDETAQASLAKFVDMMEREHAGLKYFRADHEPAFYFHGNSLLICEEDRLKKHLDSPVVQSAILSPILDDFPESDIAMVVVFEKAQIGNMLAEACGEMVHVDFDCVKTIGENASGATLRLDFDAATVVQLKMQLGEAGNMETLRAAAKELVAATREMVSELREFFMNRAVRRNQETAAIGELFDLAIELVDSANIAVSDSTLEIRIERPGGAKSLVGGLIQLVAGMIGPDTRD